MKLIKIENGEIRIGFEFADLTNEIQDKILFAWIEDEIPMIEDEHNDYWELMQKMERMQTPWFLPSEIYKEFKGNIIDQIEANEYLFNEDGEYLPIMHHYRDGKRFKDTYGKKELNCTIEDYLPDYPIQDDTWPSRKWNKERTEFTDLSGNPFEL